VVVEIFTTAGMLFSSIGANEGKVCPLTVTGNAAIQAKSPPIKNKSKTRKNKTDDR
jgi:hypothetical protein